ncbi:MAG: polysaccharide biosynthesis/export family protein [Thermonemataceae bacterium]
MRYLIYVFVLGCISLSSCKLYKENILFKSNGDIIYDELLAAKMNVEGNYRINPNDRLTFRVYSNDGQEIKWVPAFTGGMIDPNNPNNPNPAIANPNMAQQTGNSFNEFTVQQNGQVYLPMLGAVAVEGLTIQQVDSLLTGEEYFGQYFKESFVRTVCNNHRIILFKGQTGQVIPLLNENMTLIEAIAQTGGVPNNVRTTNIRLIRGDLQNPNIYVINLTSIEGVRRVNLRLRPGDIVYLEPIRRTFLESINDISPFLSFIVTTLTLTFLVLDR